MHRDLPDPGLPIKLGPCSNGEYDPEPTTPVIGEVIKRSYADADVVSNRLGVSRRDFLKTVSASALVLLRLEIASMSLTIIVPPAPPPMNAMISVVQSISLRYGQRGASPGFAQRGHFPTSMLMRRARTRKSWGEW